MTIDALLNLAMTSNNYTDSDGNTFIASASSTLDTPRQAYMPFNGTDATGGYDCWHPSSGAPQWLMLKLPEPVCIKGFTMKNRADYIECPNTVIFQGSNNGTDFEDIYEFVFSSSATKGVVKDVTFENTKGYMYYRWYISSVNASYGVISKIVVTDAEFPIIKKYLIECGEVIYTVSDGALQALSETEITANLFTTYGTDYAPDGSLLLTLVNPKVLCWTNAEEVPTLKATVTATPKNQTVISDKIDLTHSTIKGIESAVATCEGDLIIAVSFDDKQTWKAHNGTEWVTLSDEFAGMNKDTLEAITFEQWNELYNGTGFYVRISFTDTTQAVEKIVFDFAN